MNKVICFHNLNEENSWLSNWYLSPFIVEGVMFSSMEQYMMYKKAVTFGDFDMVQKILTEKDVSKVKQYGRQIANYDDVVWNGIRQIIVYRGLLAKFSQNQELGRKLKETGEAVLAECAVHDKIWGIGLSMQDTNRFNMQKWNGQNLLGFSLMQVREQI